MSNPNTIMSEETIPEDVIERARELRGAINWNSNEAVQQIASALNSQRNWWIGYCEQAVADERERCAKIAEDYDGKGMDSRTYTDHLGDAYLTKTDIASSIRSSHE